MSTTIGYAVSRVRNSIKAVKEDAFVTDRYIWSLITKYAKLFIQRMDDRNRLRKFNSLYKTIPCLELVETDKIEACCGGIKTNCIIMRTKNPIPKPFQGPSGILLRNVTSIDGSQKVYKTDPSTYTSLTNTSTFKYDKKKYYWYLNGYLYFPNINWSSVKLEGVWEDDITGVSCDASEGKDLECTLMQDRPSNIPEQLFAEIEQQVLNEILPSANIPSNDSDNKQNVFR
jgi:hypothetical protein